MRRFAAILLASAVAFSALTAPSLAQSVLTHHVRGAVSNGSARQVGRLSATQTLNLDIVLPLRDPAGLNAFLAALYNPASPAYHQYLTPVQFTAAFGPTQADYDSAVSYLASSGLTVTGGSRDGMDIQVTGPVSAIESAFRITLRTYQHPTEDRTFYGPDTEPSTGLSFSLWHVSGLDNYSIPHPLVENINDYAAAHHLDVNGVIGHATTGSGPSASFLGSDMRAAYYGAGSLNGAGQNLGLFEYLGTDLADLTTYFTNAGQINNVPVTLFSTDGTSTSCIYKSSHCDDTEQTLDMTQAVGMAPQLASLVMYIGSTDTAIISAMTTHNPLPTTIGCSWGWTPADPTTLDPYFQKMAAQGQTFLAASGDYSTWSSRGNAEAWPADDANIVSVGGTDLITAGAAGPWSSETAWADSGGGISPDKIAIPSWQQLSGVINSSNRGSTTYRNGPDISANANFTFYTCADQKACLANTYGGTSFAAPMWAGYLALANQQLANHNQGPVGFINPQIYAQNITSSYAADFHDITSGTSGSYSAVAGYDLVTGWGSPTSALALALSSGSTIPAPSLAVSASPSSISVTQGSSNTTSITTQVSGGFNAAVSFSASGQPSGVTVSFAPSSIAAPGAGSVTMNVSASRKAATGSHAITITASGGGLTQTTTVTVSIVR